MTNECRNVWIFRSGGFANTLHAVQSRVCGNIMFKVRFVRCMVYILDIIDRMLTPRRALSSLCRETIAQPYLQVPSPVPYPTLLTMQLDSSPILEAIDVLWCSSDKVSRVSLSFRFLSDAAVIEASLTLPTNPDRPRCDSRNRYPSISCIGVVRPCRSWWLTIRLVDITRWRNRSFLCSSLEAIEGQLRARRTALPEWKRVSRKILLPISSWNASSFLSSGSVRNQFSLPYSKIGITHCSKIDRPESGLI